MRSWLVSRILQGCGACLTLYTRRWFISDAGIWHPLYSSGLLEHVTRARITSMRSNTCMTRRDNGQRTADTFHILTRAPHKSSS